MLKAVQQFFAIPDSIKTSQDSYYNWLLLYALNCVMVSVPSMIVVSLLSRATLDRYLFLSIILFITLYFRWRVLQNRTRYIVAVTISFAYLAVLVNTLFFHPNHTILAIDLVGVTIYTGLFYPRRGLLPSMIVSSLAFGVIVLNEIYQVVPVNQNPETIYTLLFFIIHLAYIGLGINFALNLIIFTNQRKIEEGEKRRTAELSLADKEKELIVYKEREIISRNLHNGLGQILSYIHMESVAEFGKTRPEKMKKAVSNARRASQLKAYAEIQGSGVHFAPKKAKFTGKERILSDIIQRQAQFTLGRGFQRFAMAALSERTILRIHSFKLYDTAHILACQSA